MPLLVALLLVLSGIALFVQQNWSPSLALVFLGNRSQPLPLALWIVAAIGFGVITTIVVSLLLRETGSQEDEVIARDRAETSRSPRQPRYDDEEEEAWEDGDWQGTGATDRRQERGAAPPKPASTPAPQDSPPGGSPRSSPPPTGPETTLQSGSTSLPERPPPATTAKPEGVYDAEFRVLVPPYPGVADEEPRANSGSEPPLPIPEPDDDPEVWDEADEDDWDVTEEEEDWADPK